MRDVASLTSPALVPIFLQDISVAVNILVKAVLIFVCIYDLICICILYCILFVMKKYILISSLLCSPFVSRSK